MFNAVICNCKLLVDVDIKSNCPCNPLVFDIVKSPSDILSFEYRIFSDNCSFPTLFTAIELAITLVGNIPAFI